jgi:hypothetical protein
VIESWPVHSNGLVRPYGAFAIKERIYSFPGQGYVILLYTSGSGSEGTLGGLVSLADRIDQLVASALERGRLCSTVFPV